MLFIDSLWEAVFGNPYPFRVMKEVSALRYALRRGLSYCVIDGNALFLDVPRDRYFRLSSRQNSAFLGWCAGEMPDEASLRTLETAGVLVGDGAGAVNTSPAIAPVLRRSAAMDDGPFDLAEVARALWMQRKVERRLRIHGLGRVLAEASKLRAGGRQRDIHAGVAGPRVLRAFEIARLIRTSADKCLPRSIAVGLCLARHGIHVDVVLGVKLGPFAAHAWAQSQGEVLNDTMEEVVRFTPILVV